MSHTTSFDSRNDSLDLDQQNRSRVFSSIFSLPDEELVDDFTCALLKASVLLFQGRLFVSRDHICFYSALLSAEERTIIIPFDHIDEITKKNTAWVVPNAIEIRLKDGTEFFFASFLSRNRCYDLLQSIFRKESTPEISATTLVSSPDLSPSQSAELTQDPSLSASDALPSGDVAVPDMPETAQTEEPKALSEQCCEISFDQFESKLSETYWGKPGLEFKEIGRIEFPFLTKEVFSKLFADSGAICSIQRHLYSLGASHVQFNPWKIENGIMVRNGSLIMPISNRLLTAKSTRVQETCHCCYDPSSRSFYFRSQSISLDAPYGNCFTVLLAYDFIPVDGDNQRCCVLAHVAVYFIKSVWAVKYIIVNSTVDGIRNAFETWARAIISTCSEGEEMPVSAIRRDLEQVQDRYQSRHFLLAL